MRLYSLILWTSGLAAGNTLCCLSMQIVEVGLCSAAISVLLGVATWLSRPEDELA
jgi:hypothetical protein